MKNTILIFGILAAIVPLASEALVTGESIMRDPVTGDYTITYANAVGRLKQSHFVPSTKIDPTLRSRFVIHQGLIRYRYSIENGSKGKQPLIGMTFDPISSIRSNANLPSTEQEFIQTVRGMENNPVQLGHYVNSAIGVMEAPKGWSCDVMPNGEVVRTNFRVACTFDDLDDERRNGLQVGDSLSGFALYSMDLPGVTAAQLDGFGDISPRFVDGGPDGEISDQLEMLQNNDFVPRPAAVPTIAVPEPFDAAVTLERIQNHMHSWIAMQLLDPAFSAQLDRSFQSAISAYRLNQPKVGKQHIQAMRVLIKKEQPDADKEEVDDDNAQDKNQRALIDKLAARILDFDLKYVTKRMGGVD